MKRLTIEDMQEIAAQRGGLCISGSYTNWNTNLLWQCAMEHQWHATPTNIKRGSWCRECAIENGRLKIEEMQRIAEDRGGRCLSPKYSNSDTHLKWQCAQKHRWLATPNSVKHGTWCRLCAIVDMRHTLADMQAVALQHGGQCLSKRYIRGEDLLRWRCVEGHTWRASGSQVICGAWCKQCYYDSMRSNLDSMHALAQEKGGSCLSTVYVDAKSRLEWECAVGHRWFAKPDAIRRGWCPTCSFDQKRLGIEKMQELALQHGGRCLSDTYRNNATPLTWQCIDGHIWEADAGHIRRGQWCRECYQIRVAKQRMLDKTKKKPRFGIPKLI